MASSLSNKLPSRTVRFLQNRAELAISSKGERVCEPERDLACFLANPAFHVFDDSTEPVAVCSQLLRSKPLCFLQGTRVIGGILKRADSIECFVCSSQILWVVAGVMNSGFPNTWEFQPSDELGQKRKPALLVQLCVLRLGLFQDRHIRIGVFPQREKGLVLDS
jgi:hypothetical protein